MMALLSARKMKRRVYAGLIAAIGIVGCLPAPSISPGDHVMTATRHSHYHVHAPGIDHGHSHTDFVAGGHVHEHDGH